MSEETAIVTSSSQEENQDQSLPGNPHDWSNAKKVWIACVLGLMTLALTFTSTAYSSSTASLQQHFQVSREVVTLGISLFVVGFSVGPLVFGPLSQRIGHRPVYIGSFIAFTAFSFGASESKNIQTLLIMRFFAGSMGSSALNNVPASFREMSSRRNYGRYFAVYCFSAFGGPGWGGFIGAFADANLGWRWNLRIQGILVGVSTILCIVSVPEMSPKAISAKHQASQAEKPGARTKSASSYSRALSKFPQMCYQLICEPFSWLREPVIAVMMIYMALLYALLYGFFVSIPFAFQSLRGYSLESLGLIYLSLVVGFTFGASTLAFFQHHINKLAFDKVENGESGEFPLEQLLVQAMGGALLVPVGLFLFAWTAPFEGVHFIVPCIGIAFFCWGCCTVFTSLLPYFVTYSGPDAAVVMALGTFSRSMLAAAFPLFTRQMCLKLTLQGAMSLLGGLSLLLAPLPFVLYYYGPALRARSKRLKATSTA